MIADKVSLCKSAVLNYLAEMREEGVIDYDNRVIITEAIQSLKEERRQARIIGSVPCGTLTLETEAAEDTVNLPTRIFGSGELYLLKAYGDSMTGAGIDPGDWVVVHKQEHANNGDLVIALVEGEGSTLKRYFNDPKNKRVILHPENPKYPDIPLTDCKTDAASPRYRHPERCRGLLSLSGESSVNRYYGRGIQWMRKRLCFMPFAASAGICWANTVPVPPMKRSARSAGPGCW